MNGLESLTKQFSKINLEKVQDYAKNLRYPLEASARTALYLRENYDYSYQSAPSNQTLRVSLSSYSDATYPNNVHTAYSSCIYQEYWCLAKKCANST